MDDRDSAVWLEEMEQLRTDINCDFICLGMLEGEERVFRWKIAAGNEGERFRDITDRAGRGLTGSVIKVGRAMSLSFAELVMSRTLHEYPIVTAEKLRTAYAVPLMSGRSVIGVLLAGDRRKRIYRTEERNRIMAAGERISRLISEAHSEASSSSPRMVK